VESERGKRIGDEYGNGEGEFVNGEMPIKT
jgi:hypothetical protein